MTDDGRICSVVGKPWKRHGSALAPRVQGEGDAAAYLAAGDKRSVAALPDVAGAEAVVQDLLHGGLDGAGGGLCAQRLAQQQCAGQDGSQRVCDALPRDVGRRAAARLVQTEFPAGQGALAQRSRRQHAQRPGELRGLVA